MPSSGPAYGAVPPVKRSEPGRELPPGRWLGQALSTAGGGAGGGGGGGGSSKAQSSPVVPDVALLSSTGSRGGPRAGKKKKRVRFSREVEVRYFREDEGVMGTEHNKANGRRRWYWH